MLRISSRSVVGLAVLCLAPMLVGFTSAPAPTLQRKGLKVGQRVIRPASTPATAPIAGLSSKVKVRVDAHSQVPRLLTGPLMAGRIAARSGEAAYVATALDFLRRHSRVLRVTENDVRLIPEATLITADNQFVMFQVMRNGVAVQDSALAFRFKFGMLIQVQNLSFAEAPVTGDSAMTRAALLSFVPGDMTVTDTAGTEFWRVEESKRGYDLVSVREFGVDIGGEPYALQLSTADGSIFELRPLKHYADGQATTSLYPRYYGDELESRPTPNLNLVSGGQSLQTDGSGQFNLAEDASTPTMNGFKGKYVNVVPSTGSSVSATGEFDGSSWTVAFERPGGDDDRELAHAMVYWFTNQIFEYAKQYISTGWLNNQLRANVNLSSTCNAHWDGSTINFYSGGSGCANTGLISDVVYHEWGHGLDAKTGGIADGAFSEGYGDTMSMLFTRSHILGIGFRLNGDPVRDLEPDRIYPEHTGGGVHSEGLIIGSTNWDLYKALAESHGDDAAIDHMSKLAFQVIFTASRYTDVYDAYLVIDDDDGDLSNGTPNLCTINKVFSDHGLADRLSSCRLGALDTIAIDDSAGGNGNGVIEPGESVRLAVAVQNLRPGTLDGLTGTMRVEDASGITLDSADLSWGPIQSGESGTSTAPAVMTIDSSVPCGTTFRVVIDITANGAEAVLTENMAVGRNTGVTEAFAAGGLPVPVLDNATATATAEVSGDQWTSNPELLDARLDFDITHTYVGDLTVTLVAPNGSRFEVYRGSGSSDDVHYSEEITEIVAGTPAAGTWTLEVQDRFNSDQGTLDSFDLTLTPSVFSCDAP